MLIFCRRVSAFVAIFSVLAVSSAALATSDDLFTGTVTNEQGKPILTRCDAAENRYTLIDQRENRTKALSEFAVPEGAVFDVIGAAEGDADVTTLTVHDISVRTPRPICHMTDIDALFASAAEQPVDPNEKFDLAAMIECRSDADTAARFRNWLGLEPKVLAAAGLSKVVSRNFIAEYHIDAPLRVFGHSTTTLALHPDGFLAVLSDISPQSLARDLGAQPMLSANPFIAQKIVEPPAGKATSPAEGAIRTLTVTSREGLPQKAVAGCLYLSAENNRF
jgi:hypothetical protein